MTENASIQRKVRVTPENGLHLAPISQLVRTAVAFSSSISLSHEGKRADVKSAFDLMLLGVPHGAELDLEVSGPDAPDAAAAIAGLFETGFAHH
ncbi:MAG: Phosphocarrier protein HPr [Planctomycetota bacterium]|jgi:phosphotransferase system HPr (HPr) family protein